MNINKDNEYSHIERKFKNISLLKKEIKYLSVINSNLNLNIQDNILILNSTSNTKFTQLSSIDFKNNYDFFFQIAVKITKKLKILHDKNILHANLLNNSIYIDQNNEPYIFNFTHSVSLDKQSVTVTPIYFKDIRIEDKSPEQLGRINNIIDFRSDLYSLGLVFYQMLFNQNPFKGKDDLDSLNKVLTHIITNEDNIPNNIFNLLLKLLEKEILNRYESINGVLYDLEVLSKNFLKNMTLGKKDISTNLQISDKIYGREEELRLLTNRYYDVCKGDSKTICIGGYSGVGKSALISELKNKIISTDSYCISGKFDQYNRGKPYFGIREAFDTLAKQILLKSTEELEDLKVNILESVSDNGKILTDLVPAFENIIGQQKDIEELPAIENENRFHQFFLNFLKTIATVNTPLILIVDDLQWIDFATLKLLESFINTDELPYMYLLCSYRDNEIEGNIALQNILDNNKNVELLNLKSLDKDTLSEFLKDTLHLPKNKINDLVEEVYIKTGANPFFFRQFIFGLYDDGLIYFDNDSLNWSYNIAEIQNQNITENVADYILRKGFSSLDKETMHILQIASVLGTTFDLKILQKIDNISLNVLLEKVNNIFNFGYLLPLNVSINDMDDFNQLPSIEIKFLHDQIQQAAYSTIKEDVLLRLHYDIGNTLLEDSKDKINYFDILSHLNFSKVFFQSKEEKLKLISLNKKALHFAKRSTAYTSALNYTRVAKKILLEFNFEEFYNEFIEFELNHIELLYLTGEVQEADKNVSNLFKQIKTKDDEIELRRILSIQYTRIGRLSEAIDEGIKSLSLLDTHISKDISMEDVGVETAQIGDMVKKTPFSEIATLSQITDKKILKTLTILTEIQAAAYNSGSLVFPITVLRLLKITILHGNSYLSSYIYMMYALMNTKVLKNYKMAFEAAKYAERLQVNTKSDLLIARFNMMNSNFVMPWKDNIKEASILREKAFNQCLACGDYYWGMHSFIFGFYSDLITSDSLDKLLLKTNGVANISKKIEQISQYYLCNIQINFIKILNGENINELDRYTQFEKDALKEYDEQSYMCGKYDFIIAKLMHGFMFGYYQKALDISLNKNLDESSLDEGIFHEAFYKVFNILAILSLKIEGVHNSRYEEFLNKTLPFIDIWEENSPKIFRPIKYLIESLNNYIQENIDKSMQNYEKAISLAFESDSIFLQAIINEEYGKFWQRRDNNKIAHIYYDDAIELYRNWKAFGKVKQLESKISSNVTENTKNDIDVHVIVESTNIISSEISLEKVINNILELVIKLSGADNGFIFVNEHNIDIMAHIKDGIFTYRTNKDFSSNDFIPLNIISYVRRTKEIVLINDTSNNDIALKDNYIIENKPKSILSIPLILNNEIKAVIYLENFEGNNVFLDKDIEIIKHLSNQIVLSIEKSLFYKELENKVESRTLELKKTNENLKRFIDTQSNIVVLSDGVKATFANKKFFDFFGFNSLDKFHDKHQCICELFIENDRFFHLGKVKNDEEWVEAIDNLFPSDKIVSMMGVDFEIYAFSVSINQFDEELKIISFTDISQTMIEHMKLEEKTVTDKLTGAYNREYFEQCYEKLINEYNTDGYKLGLALFDIDYFKVVNDDYGHDVGDEVLKCFVNVVDKYSRKDDVFIRWGGEEFILILKVSSEEDLFNALEHLRKVIEIEDFPKIGQKTCSIGGTLYQDNEDIDKTIKRADEAVYNAKDRGRNMTIVN